MSRIGPTMQFIIKKKSCLIYLLKKKKQQKKSDVKFAGHRTIKSIERLYWTND